MATAWLITLPSAGLVGGLTYWIVHEVGGFPGAIIGVSLLVATASAIYLRSRRTKVDHKNVNAEWKGDLTAGLDEVDEPVTVGAGVPGGNGVVSDAGLHAAEPKKAGMP
jgi:PiT family inorganic phosphate transporter